MTEQVLARQRVETLVRELREADRRKDELLAQQRAAEEALREADRRKDEFIAILAHELRNPLAPVRNATEILRRIDFPDARLDRARNVIDRQVSHMARIIDDLLDVSRIARGQLVLRKERCDLAAIARQTAEDYPGQPRGGRPAPLRARRS